MKHAHSAIVAPIFSRRFKERVDRVSLWRLSMFDNAVWCATAEIGAGGIVS